MIKPPTVMPPAFDNARHGAIQMSSNEPELDDIVMAGDAVSLLAYGAIQGFVDTLLSPMAAASPELFTNDIPVDAPVPQASLIALLWIMAARLFGGSYDGGARSGTTLPSALLACVVPWCCSSFLLLGALAVLSAFGGLGPGASPGEIDFVMGSITVVGAWRALCSMYLPPI